MDTLTAILIIAATALVTAIVVVFRKVDKLPLPRADTQPVRRRVGTRTGTVYTPPVATATESPTDMSNVILLASIINAEASEPAAAMPYVEHHTPGHTPDPCPSTDSSSNSHSVDTGHCHTDSGSGFDGGGHGGHH